MAFLMFIGPEATNESNVSILSIASSGPPTLFLKIHSELAARCEVHFHHLESFSAALPRFPAQSRGVSG